MSCSRKMELENERNSVTVRYWQISKHRTVAILGLGRVFVLEEYLFLVYLGHTFGLGTSIFLLYLEHIFGLGTFIILVYLGHIFGFGTSIILVYLGHPFGLGKTLKKRWILDHVHTQGGKGGGVSASHCSPLLRFFACSKPLFGLRKPKNNIFIHS